MSVTILVKTDKILLRQTTIWNIKRLAATEQY